MCDRWKWTRWLPALVIASLLASAGAEEGDPSSELILLFSGEVQGNLEPCG